MKFDQMKKCVKPVLAVCACACLLFGSYGLSFSYLQSRSDTVNKFTTDSVETEVYEEFPGGGTKKVAVRNTGDMPCYVRVMLLPSALGASEGDISLSGLDADSDLAGTSKHWYHKSGEDTYGTYYYYKKILQPGETTPFLFTGYSISSSLNGMSAVETASAGDTPEIKLTVYQESSQSEGFADAVSAFSGKSSLMPADSKPVN